LAYLMALSVRFVTSLGIPSDKQRFEEKLPTERAHYSAQTFDHQIWLDRWGWVEIAGHAYRTDFDLSAHIEHSGVDLSVFKPYSAPIEKKVTSVTPIESILGPALRDKAPAVINALKSTNADVLQRAFKESGYFEVQGFKVFPLHVRLEVRTIKEAGKRLIPHVVEPSFGAERVVYATLEYAYARMKDRVILRLPAQLAPVQVMVFPLMDKDGLPEIASQVAEFLANQQFRVEYDDSGTSGRRYARADEIGVPIAITVDYQSRKDDTVTLRDRDSWNQVRNKWRLISSVLGEFLRGENSFASLGKPVEVSYE